MSTGDKTLWSELKALYTQLNTEREKFSISTITVPENSGSIMKASSIKDLSNAIQAMTSNDQLRDVADTSTIQIPNQNDQIRYTPISLLSDKITAIGEVTPCNVCFGTTFNSSTFFGSSANRNSSSFYRPNFYSTTASNNRSNFFQSNHFNTTASNNRSNFFQSNHYNTTASRCGSFFTNTSSSNGTSFWKPAHGCSNFNGSGFYSTTASKNSSSFYTSAANRCNATFKGSGAGMGVS